MQQIPIYDATGIVTRLQAAIINDPVAGPVYQQMQSMGFTLFQLAALGLFGDNVKAVYKFGQNKETGTTIDFVRDKTTGEGSYTGIVNTPVSLVAKSDNVNDTAAGTGAHNLMVYGNDNLLVEQTETIALNGTTEVPVPGSWLRAWRGRVDESGNPLELLGSNIGTISVYPAGQPTNPWFKILPGMGSTLMAMMTVSAGYHGLILNADANVGRGRDCEVRFVSRGADSILKPNSCWRTVAIRDLYQNTFTREYAFPRYVPEKTDLGITCTSTTSGVPISASFEVLLIKHGFVEGL